MVEHIYYGPWINWAHGPIRGSTLTLGDRSGGLLIAFIATFVTLVGAQLFKILVYIFHQSRSKSSAQDGLFHQQQVVFRNTTSPGAAAWTFLMQGWTWNGKAKLSFWRTFPWAFFCLSYVCLFAATAIFSSEITKGPGSARLIIGDECGYWSPNDFTSSASFEDYGRYVANESLAAAAYARACYGGSDGLSCKKFVQPSLTFSSSENVPCPFAEGMCTTGDNGAYELTAKVDSLFDLGINTPRGNRVEFQRTSTCAPLSQDGFTQTFDGGDAYGREGDTIYQYNYGPTYLTGTDVVSQNYTYQYNDHTFWDSVGYRLSMDTHTAGPSTGGWDPLPEINRTDADVTLIFLMQNSVSYSEPVDDPIFAAHTTLDLSMVVAGADYFSTDNYVSTLGCVEQYQICNPESNKCTPSMGINQVLPYLGAVKNLDLDEIQEAVVIRLMRSAQTGSLPTILLAQAENSLQAKDLLYAGLMSSGLPSNQWQLELQNWVNRGLADLQRKVVEFATGPPNIGAGSYVEHPWDNDSSGSAVAKKAMCYMQVINDTTDTVSFSIIGLVVLFAIGAAILFLSVFLEIIVGWIQCRLRLGEHARMCWLLDDKLQLHRFLNQELGHGEWTQDYDSIPATIDPDQRFQTLAAAHQRTMTVEKLASASTSHQTSTAYQPTLYQNVSPSSPQQITKTPRYTQLSSDETWLPK